MHSPLPLSYLCLVRQPTSPLSTCLTSRALFGRASSLSEKLLKSNLCLFSACSLFWKIAELISYVKAYYLAQVLFIFIKKLWNKSCQTWQHARLVCAPVAVVLLCHANGHTTHREPDVQRPRAPTCPWRNGASRSPVILPILSGSGQMKLPWEEKWKPLLDRNARLSELMSRIQQQQLKDRLTAD
jgi:hypothetical protein